MTDDFGANLRNLYEQDGGVKRVFSGRVAEYALGRPDYPEALFGKLQKVCGLSSASVIADVGAGTGKLTAGLLRHGYQVIAVEPNAEMRQACDELHGGSPLYRSVDGSAESTTLADAAVDLVTVGQAFHWFRVEDTRAEFLRILKPHGIVALIRNDRVFNDPLNQALNAIFKEFGGSKRAALVTHERHSKELEFFGSIAPQEYGWPHEQLLNESELVNLLLSRSYMPGRDSTAGKQVRVRVSEVFRRSETKGVVVVRYETTARIGRPSGRDS